MSITSESLRLQAQLEAALTHVTDAQVRALTASWVRAFDETAGDLDSAIMQLLAAAQPLADGHTGIVAKALVTRNVKLAAALAHIGQSLSDLAAQAGVRVVGDVRQIVSDAASAQAAIIGTQLPDGYLTPTDLSGTVYGSTIDAIVARTAQQITSEMYPLGTQAYDVVRREVLRGVVVGTNPRHTADRIMRRAEMGFNGGLARALTIARTESLSAHRDAAGAGMAAHADVLTGWTWLTHLSPTTCPSCLVMNGTVHPLSEPGPLDHPNGRCARAPRTKTWRELGIAMPEPPDETPDARAWFDGLPEAQQVKILGRERLELLRSGAITWDDLATLRQNPGWRPSYQATSVKALRQRAVA